MVSYRARLENRLLAAVTLDPKDRTVIRIDFNRAVKELDDFGLPVPDKPFEKKLVQLLNKWVVNKSPSDAATPYKVVNIMIRLAEEMAIDEYKLNQYIVDTVDAQEKQNIAQAIEEWRSDYYGKMTPEQKNSLLNKLQGKVSDELLDKITKSWTHR